MSAMILIVEDDAPTGELVKEVLETERHEVVWARTVAQGRTYLRKGKPDLEGLRHDLGSPAQARLVLR